MGKFAFMDKYSKRRRRKVKVIRIDDIKTTDIIDILKIDVEGSEVSVLQGSKTSLLKTKVIVWECGHFREGYDLKFHLKLLCLLDP